MNRRPILLAGAAILAAAPALAQTQQQRAQSTEGQTGGQGNPAPASSANRAEVVTAEEFLRLAAMSDRFEIASSRIVVESSQNARVKEFAQQMIRDHEKTSRERTLLQQQVPGGGAGAATPTPQGRETQGTAQSGPITHAQSGPQHEGMDQQHAALLHQLQQASGAERDRLYLRQQATAHQQAVDLFRNYSRSGDNAQLKKFAAETLPALEQHLQMAQQLQQSMPS